MVHLLKEVDGLGKAVSGEHAVSACGVHSPARHTTEPDEVTCLGCEATVYMRNERSN